ncbi:hypothetical protein AYK24_00555 [Thermoplasmatales archaeon SG8-52-4]|nr:MAG: hypothetical protein AYK24_00555 [Thermoplasmatales archaeon SG8-52-4]
MPSQEEQENQEIFALDDIIKSLEHVEHGRMPSKISASNAFIKQVQKINLSDMAELENLKNSIIAQPSYPEILSTTTRINNYHSPVFIAPTGSKMYTILGRTPVMRRPEITSNDIEIHIIEDEEVCYCTNQLWTVFVVCGKKFGTRKLDALASILLKIDSPNIIVQKYTRDKNYKNTQWVSEYNKSISKLEKYIYEILRSNE